MKTSLDHEIKTPFHVFIGLEGSRVSLRQAVLRKIV